MSHFLYINPAFTAIMTSDLELDFPFHLFRGTIFDKSRLSRDLTDRFSLNFPDSHMVIRQIIYASLGEFLCAKLDKLL